MSGPEFIKGQYDAYVYLIVHFWWAWVLLIALFVTVAWLNQNYYDN